MSVQTGPREFRVHPDRVLPDRRIIGRTLAALYVVAPVLALGWLATEDAPLNSSTGILAAAGIGLLAGGVLLTGVFERWPQRTLQVGMALATGLVSAALYFGGDPGTVLGFFYLWTAPFAFCFFTRRQATRQMLLLGALSAAALALQGSEPAGEAFVKWLIIVGTVLIVGLLVRRLTESIMESDVRFEQGFEAAQIGLAIISPDARWTRVNPALCDFLGRSEDELLGRPVADVVHPQDALPTLQVLGALDMGGAQKRFLRPNCEQRWGELSASAVRDESGRTRYLFAQIQDITERKAARDKLAERERQLADAQRIAHVGSWEWHIPRDEVTWSDQLYRIFGLVPPEFGGTRDSFLALVHPDDRKRVLRERQAAAASGESFASEWRVVRPDGEVRAIQTRAEVDVGPDGAPVRMRGTSQDVTERKAAEDALTKSERQLAEAQRLAQLGSWEWDGTTGTVICSAEMLRILGLPASPSSFAYDDMLAMVHAEDRERVDFAVREAIDEAQPLSTAFRVVRPDGEVRALHARGKPLRGPDGEVRGLFGTHQDVTERKAAEDALRRAEERFRALLDAAPDAIVGCDDQGRIVLANAQVARLTGYPYDELLGQYAVILAPPSARAEYIRRHRSFFVRGSLDPDEREFFLRRKDGTELPCEVALSTLASEEGLLAVAAIRDISERKRAQEIEARLEARLHQSERLESVGQLAGGIAHDFNNLLAVILSYARFLRDELDEGHPLGDDVREIEWAAERAADLTHQLLIFSRRDKPEPVPLDLNAIVRDTERLLGRTIGDHVDLSTSSSGVPCPVLADPGQIEQVLLNLAVNARDAMPDGGKISIETECLELDAPEAKARVGAGAGRYVRLAVSDNGHGMNSEVAARAFEPFFTTKRVGEGTGLGLASVYGIVTQAGGHIDLSSEPGVGTTVTVHLPATEMPARAVADGDGHLHAQPLEGTGETVLLVEDEDAVRDLTRRILAAHGYDVVPADTVQDALQMCEQQDKDIDLLLTDVVMPDMSGPDLADRAASVRPGLRVLFMSGYTSEIVAGRGGDNGAVPFLGKPFSTEALLRSVRDALRS
jgi:PAS domain S-box-containing protein